MFHAIYTLMNFQLSRSADQDVVAQQCNQIKHKVIVIHYMSGDDRDHWDLLCTECHSEYSISLPYDEPDLNHCPYCSPPINKENNKDYIHFMWSDGDNRPFLTCDRASKTPEYCQT